MLFGILLTNLNPVQEYLQDPEVRVTLQKLVLFQVLLFEALNSSGDWALLQAQKLIE